MLRVVLALALLNLTALAHAELVISYRTDSEGSTYTHYYRKLIQLALEKTKPTHGSYRIESAPPSTSTLRSLNIVSGDNYPNLLVELNYSDTLAHTKVIDFIEVPIDGGVFGYRVCFVNPKLKNEIAQVKSLDDLRKYTIGQGVGWADSDVLRANGFKVMEIANYNTIFKMVIAGRVDMFCRGANQIKAELEEFSSLTNLSYDESFVLAYPMPRFFYLNSRNVTAKQRMEEGLRLAFNDGSLRQLWEEEYRTNINFVNLQKRKLYQLNNPLLKNLNSNYQHYFFDPLK